MPAATFGRRGRASDGIDRGRQRRSQLRVCRDAAAIYQLTEKGACDIIDHQVTMITEPWDDAANEACLTAAENKLLWQRQILNPFIHHDQ